METEKQTLTPEQSIDLISRTIANYKSSFKSNSYYFLLWGWVISIASISHFFLIKYLVHKNLHDQLALGSFLNWGTFILTGGLIQYIHSAKEKRSNKVTSHIDKYMSVLWQVSGSSMILIGLISIFNDVYPVPFILVIAGLSTVVTSLQIKFKPLLMGGLILFVGSIITTFIHNEYQLLINGIIIIAGYIIPGYFLKSAKS